MHPGGSRTPLPPSSLLACQSSAHTAASVVAGKAGVGQYGTTMTPQGSNGQVSRPGAAAGQSSPHSPRSNQSLPAAPGPSHGAARSFCDTSQAPAAKAVWLQAAAPPGPVLAAGVGKAVNRSHTTPSVPTWSGCQPSSVKMRERAQAAVAHHFEMVLQASTPEPSISRVAPTPATGTIAEPDDVSKEDLSASLDDSSAEASGSGFRTPSTSSLSGREVSPDSDNSQQKQRKASGLGMRCRRQSTGLVYNPGPSTVQAGNRRFSLARSSGGEQLLLPFQSNKAGTLAPTELSQEGIDSLAAKPLADEAVPNSVTCHIEAAAISSVRASGSNARASGGCESMARRCREAETLESFSEQTDESISELFNRYVSAENAHITLRTFWQLLRRCGDSKPECQHISPPHRRIARLEGLPWRAQSVWALLNRRTCLPEYSSSPLTGKNAVVCGAGPCGLRTALELALLGAQVVVVEKRATAEAFGRINRVHLWEWVKQDLLSWGAKIFDPPGGTFGGDNDFCHIGIGELQLLLLKSALLLGVNFRFACKAKEIEAGSLVCGHDTKLPCDFLFVADGANSTLSHALGLRSMAIGLRGKGSAIGVVANFTNNGTTEQKALRQFSWARQFNMPLFNDLKGVTQIDLENCVYYKGQTHHYMVMTPTKRSLLDAGVLRDGKDRCLLHGSNVDIQHLSTMVQSIAAFFGLPTELCESQGAMIFDFSGIKRLENAATMVDGVFVCAVGDALLEPFWPEGLGIMRGFMSAFDAAQAAVTATVDDARTAVAQTSSTYNILKSVTAQSASQCLQKDCKQYRLWPASRYILSPSWMPPERGAA